MNNYKLKDGDAVLYYVYRSFWNDSWGDYQELFDIFKLGRYTQIDSTIKHKTLYSKMIGQMYG